MQALYQLSYSPLRPCGGAAFRPLSPGFPGGDANITQSCRCTTKAFPFCPDTFADVPSGRHERVEALEGAVLLEEPAVDRLTLQLAAHLDRVAFYCHGPPASL